jgi:hypothetical protein
MILSVDGRAGLSERIQRIAEGFRVRKAALAAGGQRLRFPFSGEGMQAD